MRIVFEVGVLNQDVVARRLLNASLDRLALALIRNLGKYANRGKARGEASGNLPGIVLGAVVDDQDLLFEAQPFNRHGENSLDQRPNERTLVIRGDDDG